MPRLGRIPIRDLSPRQPENRWVAKSFVGEVVPFEATVFRDGHDLIGVQLLLTDPLGAMQIHRMQTMGIGTDRWRADVQLSSPGTWRWCVRAFTDDWQTWQHNAELKIAAGVDVELMLTMAEQLLARAGTRKIFSAARKGVKDTSLSAQERLAMATQQAVIDAMNARPLMSLETLSEAMSLRVERSRAAVGSWYEFFPRSEGARRRRNGSWTSGTFRTAAQRLPAVAAMGFDVLYVPPIHPIGTTHRKGPNNTLNAGVHDPGSPWAIGSPAGGHDAIHPDLGTEADFSYFLRTARKAGLEVAIDLALQCSPDHPWVTEHPEWFTTLPDGSIAFAENPPKKYQDIYPLNFDNDPEGIRTEILRIVEYWISLGVHIFRVDNPHTKPLAFWEWLLAQVYARYPEVVFLAEAFTRPAMMQSLAGVGFQQSYTYFTWRNTKAELESYFRELSQQSADYFRPNLFVNTPDILSEYLQFGGRGAYKIRAALAATASPSWGVYAGFELFEHVARPGSEENIDNEKYEYKRRDWAAAEAAGTTLAPYLTRLNLIRAAHPSLRQLRNLAVHWTDDDSILAYTKYLAPEFTGTGTADGLIIVANLDSHAVRETFVHLDLGALGLDPDDQIDVTDLMTGDCFTWGRDNYVRLDPFLQPVHILRVEYPKGS
ncbi:MAG: alpha-1,4-glucan--maltose-1-phosphate maltosyltransferase [Rhodoglobus sp.]